MKTILCLIVVFSITACGKATNQASKENEVTPVTLETESATETSEPLANQEAQSNPEFPIPSHMREAKELTGSIDGSELGEKPKLTPDGRLYHFYGKIEQASGDAVLLITRTMTNIYGIPVDHRYYRVHVPDYLRTRLTDATINGSIGIIGQYTQNQEFDTTAGTRRVMPVFHAIYLEVSPKSPDLEELEDREAAQAAKAKQIEEVKAERAANENPQASESDAAAPAEQ